MADILWGSEDGYVIAADQVMADDEVGAAELTALFNAGAWIVLWRAVGSWRWRLTRSRRYAKPGLRDLRVEMRKMGWAGELYVAWQNLALEAIPAKLAFLQRDADNYESAEVNAWLRPGIALHKARRIALCEIINNEIVNA